MTGTGTRREPGSGPDHEKEAEIHTKIRAGSLKLYELEKQMAPVDAVRVRRRNSSSTKQELHLRTSVSSPSMSIGQQPGTART